MHLRRNLLPLLFAAGFAPMAPIESVSAQGPIGFMPVTGEFTPNPAAPGQTVTFTMTNVSGAPIRLTSACVGVTSGTQTGPSVSTPWVCPGLYTLPPGGALSIQWDQRDATTGALVPTGDYWFTHYGTPGRVYSFCLGVRGPGEPTLRAITPVRTGQTTPLQISSPADAGAVYFTAMSFSPFTPVRILGLDTCLSAPLNADGFTAPFGVLDPAGRSQGLGLVVPGIPSLVQLNVQVQSLIFGPNRNIMTNGLSLVVR